MNVGFTMKRNPLLWKTFHCLASMGKAEWDLLIGTYKNAINCLSEELWEDMWRLPANRRWASGAAPRRT